MIRVSAPAYFLVVSASPRWMRAALVAATAAGVATLWLNPREVDSAVAGVLLLQMFACSTGFPTDAARGYFDPILVGGRPRCAIAAGHLIASAAPGAMAWVVLTATSLALGAGTAMLAPARAVALITISGLSWALGVRLPRMAAGALWCVALVVLLVSREGLINSLVLVKSVPTGPAQVAAATAAFLACPFLLLGTGGAAGDLRVLALTLGGVLIAMTCSAWHIVRRDFALEDPA